MFPNAIVEAMTYGNCFVATNTQGVPETAQNNEGVICDCGALEQYEAAFIDLLDNPERREQMGENGIKSVLERFNIKEVVNKIESAYRSF